LFVAANPAHPYVGRAEKRSGPPTVCAAGPTVQGADVSIYEGTIDWPQVANAGLSFAIAKATEGLTIQDSEFAANWSGMKSIGLVRGAYHFFHSLDDGTAQAAAFLAKVGGFSPGDLPPFLDWEVTDTGDNAAHAILEAQAFVDEIRAQTGLTTVIYTDPTFWAGLGDTSQFSANPLWIANYGVTCPRVPSPWSGWQLWQLSSSGTIPGMNCADACDLDEFDGSLAELQAFAGAVSSDGGPAPWQDAGEDAGFESPTDGGDDAGAAAPGDAGGDAGRVAPPDAGADGGFTAHVDAGEDPGAPRDTEAPQSAGCSCGSGGTRAPLFWILGALALLRRRSTRVARRPALM
jgi:lysozyme